MSHISCVLFQGLDIYPIISSSQPYCYLHFIDKETNVQPLTSRTTALVEIIETKTWC